MATIDTSTTLIILLMVGLAFYFNVKLSAVERRLVRFTGWRQNSTWC